MRRSQSLDAARELVHCIEALVSAFTPTIAQHPEKLDPLGVFFRTHSRLANVIGSSSTDTPGPYIESRRVISLDSAISNHLAEAASHQNDQLRFDSSS